MEVVDKVVVMVVVVEKVEQLLEVCDEDLLEEIAKLISWNESAKLRIEEEVVVVVVEVVEVVEMEVSLRWRQPPKLSENQLRREFLNGLRPNRQSSS